MDHGSASHLLTPDPSKELELHEAASVLFCSLELQRMQTSSGALFPFSFSTVVFTVGFFCWANCIGRVVFDVPWPLEV